MGLGTVGPLAALSDAEIEEFCERGFVIRRGALSVAAIAAAREAWWACLQRADAPPRLKRDEPETWRGAFPTGARDDGDPRSSWGGAGWRCRHIGNHPSLLDLLPRAAFGLAEQLCGARTLVYPEEGATVGAAPFAHPGANYASGTRAVGALRTCPGHACRGVYCSLPGATGSTGAGPFTRGHVDGWDGQRWRLSVSTYLQDVPPGGGAFCVWPTSHRATWGLPMGQEGRPTKVSAYEAFNAELKRINDDESPEELYGAAGDLLIWHSRIVHAAPPNGGAEPLGLRPNVIYDFHKLPFDGLEETPEVEIVRGDPVDIWEDWSMELRRVAATSAARL